MALIAGMFAAFAIPAFATADHALPTTYNGKTINWSVSGKLGTVMGADNYYADVPMAYSALYNLYHQAPTTGSAYADASFDGLANTVAVWTAPGGFFEGQGVVWNENAAAWPKVLAGEALIAGLTAEQKAAAADEIAYFAFVAGKVKEFTIALNSNDTWHQGLDVIGFIVGDAVRSIYIASNPLEFDSASLALKDSIAINFILDPKAYTDIYAIFHVNGKDVTVTEYTVNAEGKYVFKLSGIAPYQMGMNVLAMPFGKYQGTFVGGNMTDYSVKEYINNKLAEQTAQTELSTLLVNLLNYGAACQTAVGNTDPLVNAGLTAEQLTWGTTRELGALSNLCSPAYVVDEDATVTWESASLLLNEAVTMRLKFKATTTTGLSVVVKNAEGAVVETITTFDAVAGEDGCYYVRFNGIAPHQYENRYTFTVMDADAGVAESNTLSYSVASYVVRNTGSSNSDFVALLQALMNYGSAAAAYTE